VPPDPGAPGASCRQSPHQPALDGGQEGKSKANIEGRMRLVTILQDYRETLLLEMIEQGMFEVERARAVIGISRHRQKRTEQKVDITVQEFGQEWLEHKKTAISVAKVEEYRNILGLICSTKVELGKKKPSRLA
jgi:hypothetical protein